MSQTVVAAKLSKPLAEFVGTFIMVFCGCGAMTVNEITGGTVTHVGVGIVWGAIVMIMIYSLGKISGCHINPAVTISFWATGRLKLNEVPTYIVSQILGATTAGLVLTSLFPESQEIGMTLFSGSETQAFIVETIITFILMLVILNVANGSKEEGIVAAIAIGFYIMVAALFAGPVTRASLNPARSIGPALAIGNLAGLWIYIVAPILGALLSIPVWKIINAKSTE